MKRPVAFIVFMLLWGSTAHAFDATKYLDHKTKGVEFIEKIDSQFIITKKAFDPETGEELDSEVRAVTIEQLESEQASLEQRLSDIKTVIKELKQMP